MFTSLLLGAVFAIAPAPTLQSVSGTVTYRERIALPAGAVLVVSLDRFGEGGQANLSELRMDLGGRQVPVSFTLPYYLGARAEGDTFGVRAVLLVEGERWFESASHAMVIANGSRRADKTLVRTLDEPGFRFEDQDWRLAELGGLPVSEGSPPTLTFRADGKRLEGFTGVNRFGGAYAPNLPQIQIDPGAITRIAGTPDQMALERRFLEALVAVNRVELFEGNLTLFRGERALARFVRAD